ncbi:MAG: M56 family metallopeptidase [Candidatus Sumerlaeia bacterium]
MMQLMRSMVDLPAGWSILLKASALLAFGWVMHAALMRANPRWRVLLWRGVLVGLAALPILSAIVALPVSLREPLPPPAAPMELPRVAAVAAPMIATEAAPVELAEEPPEPPINDEPPEPSFSLTDWLRENWAALALSIWALGVAFLTLRLLAAYLHMAKTFSAAKPASVAHEELLRRIAHDLGFHRPVRLRITTILSSPLVAGLRRPVIYLPERFGEAADRNELAAILAHEVAHLRARDLYWLMAARVCSILLWPHPLAWRTLSAHASACEEVSDAVAAGYLKDAAAYVRTLARVALSMK